MEEECGQELSAALSSAPQSIQLCKIVNLLWAPCWLLTYFCVCVWKFCF